jgi:ribosomal protein L37AE/L43A
MMSPTHWLRGVRRRTRALVSLPVSLIFVVRLFARPGSFVAMPILPLPRRSKRRAVAASPAPTYPVEISHRLNPSLAFVAIPNGYRRARDLLGSIHRRTTTMEHDFLYCPGCTRYSIVHRCAERGRWECEDCAFLFPLDGGASWTTPAALAS